MHLIDLAILYASPGTLTTFYLRWRQRVKGWARLGEWIMTGLFWPFAMALAFSSTAAKPKSSPHDDPAERALGEAFEAVQGSQLESLLPESASPGCGWKFSAVARDSMIYRASCKRRASLSSAHANMLVTLSARVLPSETLGSARLQLDNAMRLAELRRRDTQVLEELTELLRVLRAQLVLARYAGSAPAGIADVVNEVWARVEVLGISLEPSEGARLDDANSRGASPAKVSEFVASA